MAEIKFIEGDATRPQGPGIKVIVHCCNNLGKWGSGFVVALSKRWPEPEDEYRELDEYVLGSVMIARPEDLVFVANVIGQDGIGIGKDGIPPVRYEALRKGFQGVISQVSTIQGFAKNHLDGGSNAVSIHMPRIGSGLAGGDWALVERVVETTFLKAGLDVTVYDFPGGTFYDSRRDGNSRQTIRGI